LLLRQVRRARASKWLLIKSSKYDADEIALFIRRFKKFMTKEKIFKGDKKNKTRTMTKRMCYNCSKYDHFIVNYPYEHRSGDEERRKKKEKNYKKDN
jgi:hypothetical protein